MLSYALPNNCPITLIDTQNRTQSTVSQNAYSLLIEKAVESISASRYLTDRHQFEFFSAALAELARTEANWNSYNAPTPTVEAIEDARRILAVLRIRLLMPSRVLPSADGGVSLIFSSDKNSRAVIECLNDRQCLLVLYDLNGNVDTFEWPAGRLASQIELVDKLQYHLRSRDLAASRRSS
jgi:hypothetical protein